jgi:signal transduction histidine kinase
MEHRHACALVELQRTILRERDRQTIFAATVALIARAIDVDAVEIAENRGGRVVVRASEGIPAPGPSPLKGTPFELAIARREAVSIELDRGSTFPERAILRSRGARSLLTSVVASEGRVHGFLSAYEGERRSFDAGERELLETAAGMLGLWLAANDRPPLAVGEAECLAAMSHDLRTPLTAVDLAVQSLAATKSAEDARARIAELVPLVRRNITRMNLLISDLLFLEGAEREAPALEVREHSVIELLHEVYALMRDASTQRGVSLLMCLPHGDLRVDCDRHRIIEVLTNLLGSALRSTSRGGMIEVDVKARPEATEFQVRDTGSAIHPTEVDALFERRQRHPSEGGTGLGLLISRAIVEAHGGTIGARSGAGEGTVLHFDLPLRPRASGEFLVHTQRAT